MFYREIESMHPLPQQTPVNARRSETDTVAAAYRRLYRGDDRSALLAVIIDALADLDSTEQQISAQTRQVSHGYFRAIIAGR